MLVYIVLLAVILLLANTENESNAKIFSFFVFFFIWFVISFRDYSVGSDTYSYILDYISENEIARNIDIGYTYYCNLLRTWNVSPRLFMMISSYLMVFPVLLFINKGSRKKMMSYFLFITIGTFAMCLTGIRQSIAIGIVLLGYVITSKTKHIVIRYSLLFGFVFLARMFHNSAYICYLFIPLMWLSERIIILQKKWLPFFLVAPLLLLFSSSLVSNVVEYFMISRYEDYELGFENINLVSFLIIPYCIFSYNTIFSFKYGLNTPFDYFCFLCSFIYMICAISSLYMPILARLSFYYSLPTLVLIPNVTSKMQIKNQQFVTALLIIVCLSFFMISTSGGILRIDHYKFGFN